MATKVSIAELGSAVSKILTTYNRDIQRGIREEKHEGTGGRDQGDRSRWP